ncbi:MAG: hypothetical protein ACRDFS_06655, partial [Chloroflexota bacterium]
PDCLIDLSLINPSGQRLLNLETRIDDLPGPLSTSDYVPGTHRLRHRTPVQAAGHIELRADVVTTSKVRTASRAS